MGRHSKGQLKDRGMRTQVCKGSGVEGLDGVLSGGFPERKVYLIEGDPGAGKTTLALQFLIEGAKKGEGCLYITLSESNSELLAVAESHGWDIKGIHIFEALSESQLDVSTQNTFFHTSELELGETSDAIQKAIEEAKPDRIVFDSLSELRLLAQDPMKFRRQILSLKHYFAREGMTVLLLDDKTVFPENQELHSIVHGVIQLEQLSPEYGSERRRLRVSKLRGVSYRGGYHDFSIRTGGIIVFPRLIAAEHGEESAPDILKSGITELDKIVGGGIDRGSSTLIMGPAGTGKSTLAVNYAVYAAKGGLKVAMFIFDEGRRTLLERSKGLGIDLQSCLDSKMFSLRQIDPAEVSPGEFAMLVRKAVDQEDVKLVIIDSLNGYINAMPSERYLVIQMHELLSYLGQMGATTLIVAAQHGLIGSAIESPVDVSYLADNVLLLRYYEYAGEVRQAVSVVKKRSGAHERTIRDLSMSSKGLVIGPPIQNVRGILSGTPNLLINEKSLS